MGENLQNGLGKLSKVRNRSVKSQGIFEWLLIDNPGCSDIERQKLDSYYIVQIGLNYQHAE